MVASLIASVLFGVLFFLPPLVSPLEANSIFAWRIFITLPLVAAALLLSRRMPDVQRILRRVRARPLLAVVIVCNGLLLGVQLWLFGWAPLSGHGLDVALGYLLLPLMMVIVGRVLHGDALPPLRLGAVIAAAVGVVFAVALTGQISAATLIVMLGYPVYFELRGRFGLNSPGALALELTALLPVAVWFAFGQTWPATDTPRIIVGLLAIGLVSAVALLLYLRASELLPFGLFGMLSYVEPVLLTVVAVALLGETMTAADLLVYGPITLALVLLCVEAAIGTHTRRAD
ncbi:EamA family transporter RarD [Microbacterium sp. Sa4CUA7]|uniref:EamA family transporter RarD n=1 Tax=Microbacterium pullorum TaxID=2762236 RepID=A0ABR8S4G0_9MICO|nr:EamA family transporter RarD [Microbacterium pullorum]MBD7958348.1 EamA family transporter RarD [Microbacterium pullorum]